MKRPPENDTVLTCQDVHEDLHRFIEGELESIRASFVTAHLERCPACRELRAELEAERRWVLESIVEAPRLPASFAATIREAIRAESGSAASEETLDDVPAHETLESVPAHETLESVPAHETLESVPAHETLESVPAHETLESVPAHETLESVPAHEASFEALPSAARLAAGLARTPWIAAAAAFLVVASVSFVLTREALPRNAGRALTESRVAHEGFLGTPSDGTPSDGTPSVRAPSVRAQVARRAAPDAPHSVTTSLLATSPLTTSLSGPSAAPGEGSRFVRVAALDAYASDDELERLTCRAIGDDLSPDAFCAPIDDLAFTARNDAAEETSDPAAASRAELRGRRVRPNAYPASFGAVYALARRIAPEEDPCESDINDDGQTDAADVTLALYVLWNSSQPTVTCPLAIDSVVCDDPCL